MGPAAISIGGYRRVDRRQLCYGHRPDQLDRPPNSLILQPDAIDGPTFEIDGLASSYPLPTIRRAEGTEQFVRQLSMLWWSCALGTAAQELPRVCDPRPTTWLC